MLSSIIYTRLLFLGVDSLIVSLGLPALLLYALFVNGLWQPRLFLRAASCRFVLINVVIAVLLLVSAALVAMRGGNVVASGEVVLKQVLLIACLMAGIMAGARHYASAILALDIFLIVYVASGILGLVQLAPYEVVDGIVRPIGLAGYSEVMGHVTMFALLYGVGMWLMRPRRVRHLVLAGLSVVLLLFSSHLKNILIGIPALLLLLRVYERLTVAQGLGLTAMVVVLAGVAVAEGGTLPFVVRIKELVEGGLPNDLVSATVAQNSAQFRLIHWRMLLGDWYEHYFLFGTGPGNVYDLRGFGYELGHRLAAHSDLVGFVVELGVVLSPLFFLLIIRMAWLLYKLGDRTAPFRMLFVIYVALVGASLAGSVYFSAAHLYLFWFVVGVFSARVNRPGFPGGSIS